VGSTDVFGAHTMTTSWADYATDWLTNPATGLAWTEAQVEGDIVSFGLQNTNTAGSEECQVSQQYLTVEYTDAGGGGGNRRRRVIVGA
jgi:hypothetical protein